MYMWSISIQSHNLQSPRCYVLHSSLYTQSPKCIPELGTPSKQSSLDKGPMEPWHPGRVYLWEGGGEELPAGSFQSPSFIGHSVHAGVSAPSHFCGWHLDPAGSLWGRQRFYGPALLTQSVAISVLPGMVHLRVPRPLGACTVTSVTRALQLHKVHKPLPGCRLPRTKMCG